MLFLGDLDPAGLDEQYAAFKQNLQRFGRIWDVSGSISPPKDDDGTHVSSWRVLAKTDTWSVETEYRCWDWSDIARQSLADWTFERLGLCLSALFDFLKSGTFWRYLRTNPKFGFLFLYPLLLVLSAGLIGLWLSALFGNAGLPFAFSIGLLIGAILLAAYLRWIDPVFCSRIAKMWVFLNSAIHLTNLTLAQRLGIFSADLVAVLKSREFDEILVIGHGLGVAFIPVVLDRAFWSYPEFGKNGEKISLLTLGSQLLSVGLHPEASWLIGPLSRVARDRMVYWLDYQTDGDVLGFAGQSGVGLLTESKGRPEIQLIEPFHQEAHIRRPFGSMIAKNRQMLLAQPTKVYFDLFAACCGPYDLKARGRNPAQTVMPIECAPA